MEYVDIEFPPRLAFGAQRRPGWSTTVVATLGGAISTNQNWSRAQHRFDVSFAVRTENDYEEIVDHFHSVRGRAKKFGFRDPLDHTVTAVRGVLIEEANSDGDYQLAKRYGTGSHAWDRLITRPIADTVVILRTRSSVTTDITADSTIDDETGLVEINPAVLELGDVLAWTGSFLVPCQYGLDELPTIIVNKQPDEQLLVSCDSIPIVEVREPA